MTVLGYRELDDLARQIESRAGTGDLVAILSRANQRGELDAFLSSLGFDGLLGDDKLYDSSLKILVIGGSMVKASKIQNIAKHEGIDPDRLELCLDYEEAKRYPYYKINPGKYRAVIFGPLSHSASGKGEASSVITNFERRQSDGVLIVRAVDSTGELKLTNTSVKRAFREINERCAN